MPVRFFTDAERERLDLFPEEVEHNDLITFFTLSDSDKAEIPVYSAAHNRIGFALQLGALRFMGFVPDDLASAPASVVHYVANQMDIEPGLFSEYGVRDRTRTDHLRRIAQYVGYRKADEEDLKELSGWLLNRALEHDKPRLLYDLTCDKLRSENILRPGVTRLERLVAEARQEARFETMRCLASILTDRCRSLLDSLLTYDSSTGGTSLSWLRRSGISNSPRAILGNLERLAFLKDAGVSGWNLDNLNPNRLKLLAQIARRSAGQALQRSPAERRYPTLVAFLRQSLLDITDETIDMFDCCLAQAYARAGRDLKDFRTSVARATNAKVRLFRDIGLAVLNPDIGDADLRAVIYRIVPEEVLRSAVKESDEIMRPLDDSYFDFLESRYGYIRQFASAFLDAFTFRSNLNPDPLLKAVNLLQNLNAERRRGVPDDTPLDFVPSKWRPYVIDHEGRIDRHYYELCVLWRLREALRSGDVWLEASRRYANPESYLIPKDIWPSLLPEVLQQIQIPNDSTSRLKEREIELETLLNEIDPILSSNGNVRLEDGNLILSPLKAQDRPESVVLLERLIDERLPQVELTELLIEVDSWTGFSRCFEHAGGSEPRSQDLLRHLYASVLAQGCNLGLTRMAQISDSAYDRLAWCTTWYIREETLKSAVSTVVNFHYRHPLSQYWGGGTLSSSDGQRFPVSGKIRNATALPRYFGYGKGVTFYTWTSDQFSQYGTKVISSTMRDATYVLDEILDNETELSIVEHTTDTAGYTDLVFALFDLLGMRFSPRIRDIGDQRLYRLNGVKTYQNLEPRLKGRINHDLIIGRWDDLLRVAGSLKLGWVTASLLISKLQSYPRQTALTRALQEYGRLIKTIFILRYLGSEEFRRRINAQLNKGEALHSLREFLFFANQGTIRRKQEEGQTNQAICLNLITNAVVTWNTVYMAAAIDRLREEGLLVRDEDLQYLSPARYEHLNPYGKYRFDIEEELSRKTLRPLRQP